MGNSREGQASNRRRASESCGRKRIRNGWNYDEFSGFDQIKSLELEEEEVGEEEEEEEEEQER